MNRPSPRPRNWNLHQHHLRPHHQPHRRWNGILVTNTHWFSPKQFPLNVSLVLWEVLSAELDSGAHPKAPTPGYTTLRNPEVVRLSRIKGIVLETLLHGHGRLGSALPGTKKRGFWTSQVLMWLALWFRWSDSYEVQPPFKSTESLYFLTWTDSARPNSLSGKFQREYSPETSPAPVNYYAWFIFPKHNFGIEAY